MKIEFNDDELACILVGLAEFEDIIDKKPRAFGVYKKINHKLVEKFRQRNWDMIQQKNTPVTKPVSSGSFLVKFTYDHYCQGFEEAEETVLVKNALSFADACIKIADNYKNARRFKNLTLE